MPNIFEPVILQLREIGAFQFLFPFVLTSAIFYGLLRKSEIFGKPERNVAVNGVISLVASFMVWAFPIIQGVDIEAQLSAFFAQGTFVTLGLMIALMFAGMIIPEPSKALGEFFKGNKVGGVIIVSIALGIFIFITSGLFNLIVGPSVLATIPSDIIITVAVIILLIVPLYWIMGQEGENPKKE